MTKLGVNIDHVATIRQARQGIEPDPVYAAAIAEENGADQITIHLREDRRHIQNRDLKILRSTVKTRLNLEMAATPEMVTIAKNNKPDTVTLVPEKREELTTEGGLALTEEHKEIISALQEAKIEVSVFIEPDIDLIKLAKKLGADAVEIHTGRYANLTEREDIEAELSRIKKAAKQIKSSGMRVIAGHGLNYQNTQELVEMQIFEEFNIGHSIISRSLFSGLAEAVQKMKEIVSR
ncbi:MAG: pyridoxine 5'-phosphate synthase [Candidatus Cloacimonadales bacterium]